MKPSPTFLDLFAGAGGLSEGFVRAGFRPVAHVEMDKAACFTLKTRQVYHWLLANNGLEKYFDYVRGKITRDDLYAMVPKSVIDIVLNRTISSDTIDSLCAEIDNLIKCDLDLIIGGPPCQAYSLVGRARDSRSMKKDSRNYLYRMYAHFLEYFQPRFFVFENVTGLLSAKNESGTPYLDVMKRLFRSKGYSTKCKIVSASDFGVPQNRYRVILIGKRLTAGERASSFVYPELIMPQLKKCTIDELFSDLPQLHAGEGSCRSVPLSDSGNPYLFATGIRDKNHPETSFHIARNQTENDLMIYKIAATQWKDSRKRLVYSELPEELIHHNNRTSFLDRFKVVDGSATSSHTVVAHIHKDGHYYIHPDVQQNRSLTPREAARLQTFPDDFFFESASGVPSKTAAYRQIGNAVPVLLAESIARSMRRLLDD